MKIIIPIILCILLIPAVAAVDCPSNTKGYCGQLNDRACFEDNIYYCQSYQDNQCWFFFQECAVTCEFGECVQTTCQSYCDNQIHEPVKGYWDVSGKYPNCACNWVEEKETKSTCPLRIPVPEDWGVDECLAGWIALGFIILVAASLLFGKD